jgi:hypothetical protein
LVEDVVHQNKVIFALPERPGGVAEGTAGRQDRGQDLDGATEAEEVRAASERVQNLSLEIREKLDAYQNQHTNWGSASLGG